MAGKRGKEIQLQREVETQEEWEDMLSKEGLCVIDVYQEWCGKVAAMVSVFKKIKNEIGDSKLHFICAKADTIDALEKYRGRCEPCFLFFAGGVLVAVIRGANAPLILRTITEQLAQEHKCIDGQAERKEIKDTLIATLQERDRQQEAAEEAEREAEELRMKFQGEIVEFGDEIESSMSSEAKKEVSVVIIKPDAVLSGKSEEILAEMKNRGIEILRQEDRQLTEEEAKNVYIHLQDEPFFEELIAFMTSSPSIVLAITKGKTGENIIKEFRELIGPTEVEEAKEQAPDSLRAKFGSEKYMNAVHGSDSTDTAARELAFFFPDFVAPAVAGKAKVQRTLALIRPDAYKNHKDEIIKTIRDAGFKIAMQKEMHLSKEQVAEFYSEHQGQEYFDELTDRMSSGPLLALGLAREEAVSGWREMLGPTKVEEAKEQQPQSLRAQFSEEGAQINMLHGSDSEESAKKEIEYFFPMEQTIAAIKPDAIGTKAEIIDKIHDAGFRIAARKETTLSREMAEEFYADHKDKEYYNDLVEHMVSGPTYFMVLSREGAVDGWRSMIGAKDPNAAKEEDPDSLRGLFGTDTLKNAVHGSSNPEHAMESITKIFGELFFNKDGTVREEEEEAGEQQEPVVEERAMKSEPAPEYGIQEKTEDDSEADYYERKDQEPSPPPQQRKKKKKPKEEEAKPGTPTQQTTETQEEKPGSPTQQTTEGDQGEETKQAEQEGETSEAQPEKGEVDEKPAESTEQTEEGAEQTEDKPKSPEPTTEQPAEQTEQAQEESKPVEEPQPVQEEAKQPEPEPEQQKEEPKPESKAPTPEPQPEPAKEEEPKQEEAAPEAEPAEEKKEEPAEEKKEESAEQEKKEEEAKPEAEQAKEGGEQ